MTPEALSARSRSLMQALRRPTYARDDILPGPVTQPYVFYAPNLCGEYAIFIFGSYRCDKYLKGLCTPCHYSGLPHPAAPRRRAVHDAVLDQTDYLLRHFDDLVIARQHGTGHGYRLPRSHPDGKFVDLQIAGEGSFLADGEVPARVRREVLERIARFARQERVDMHLGLEVKAEDVVRAEARGELESWGDLVSELNMSLIMGFESADPFVRNVIFNKDLSTDAVERAIDIGHRRGMRPTAFVYTGNHAMTDSEVIADALASMAWLREREAGIYLMFPNLQPHTIPHVLYHAGHHDLVDLRTALPIVDALLAGGRGESTVHFHAGWDWNIGGLTSEPDPELNIFTNPRSASCAGCRSVFRRALWQLALTHDVADYRQGLTSIASCDCLDTYGARRASQAVREAVPLEVRVAADLDAVAHALPGYSPSPSVVRTGPGKLGPGPAVE